MHHTSPQLAKVSLTPLVSDTFLHQGTQSRTEIPVEPHNQ